MATLTAGGITYSDGTLTNSSGFNGVGSYVLGYRDTSSTAGSNYAAGASAVRSGFVFSNCGTMGLGATNNLSGTWRSMGGSSVPYGTTSLFVRVA
jgi:hypothetical protein